jgi:hypothetical protein
MGIVRAVVVTVVVTELVVVTGSVVVTASGFIVVGSTSKGSKKIQILEIFVFLGVYFNLPLSGAIT